MTGTKATRLHAWAEEAGRAFLRFDYSGHGASSGAFEDGAIGDWAEDAYRAFSALTQGPQILIGSSMGGWISLLLIKRLAAEGAAERVCAFVGVAAAPDFTEDSMTAGLTEDQAAALDAAGRIELPSDYSPDPYIITKRLLEEGRNQLVLREPLVLPFPVRLFQGTADKDVEPKVALRLLDHIDCPDAQLTLIKDAGHSLSEPRELELLIDAVESIA